MRKTKSKAGQAARDQGLISGFPKRLATAQILVDGTTYTATSAVALLQTRVTAAAQLASAKAGYLAAAKAADAVENATAATVSGLVEAVYVAFGDDPAALSDFNLPVRKKGVMTPAQRLEASAKAKATRVARHTMGPKQKLAITGTAAPAAAAPATGAIVPPVGGTASK